MTKKKQHSGYPSSAKKSSYTSKKQNVINEAATPLKIKKEKQAGDSKIKNSLKKDYVVQILKFSYLIIIALVVVVYAQTLFYGFVNLDDKNIIIDHYKSIDNLSKIGDAFTTPYIAQNSNFYRPIVTISFIIDAQIAGQNPYIYHLSNMIMHALACCSIFYFLKLIKLKRLFALVGAAIYAVHPLFINAVAWIVGRNDILVTLLCILSFNTFIRYRETNKYIYLALHFILIFLAVFTKEIALVFPAVLIAYVFMFERRRKISVRIVFIMLGWLIIDAIFLIMRNQYVTAQFSEGGFGINTFIRNFPAILEYVSKFYFPIRLAPLPMFNYVVSIIGIILIIVMIYASFNNKSKLELKYVLFGLFWFFIFLLPGMATSPGKALFDYLECRIFLPAIGLLIFLGSKLPETWLKKYSHRFLWGSVGILLLLSVYNLSYSGIYSEPMKFYNEATRKSPKSALAFFNRGTIKDKLEDFSQAIPDYSEAIRINSKYAEAYNNRGLIFKKLNRFKEAIADYTEAISIKPGFSDPYCNRAIVRIYIGDYYGGIEDANKAISLKPDYTEAYNNRGIAKYYLHDFNGALRDYKKVVEINPQFSEGYNNLGSVCFNIGDNKAAIDYYSQAIKINPNYTDAYANRASAKYTIGEFKGACEDWSQAAKLGHQDAKIKLEEFCK